MDTTILVEELSANAVELIKALDESGFEFTIAALTKNLDGEDWRLTLGVPGLRERGPKNFLTQINNIIMSKNLQISLYDIILVDDQDRLFNLLRLKIHTENKDIKRIYFNGNYLSGLRFPDSIIYRVVA